MNILLPSISTRARSKPRLLYNFESQPTSPDRTSQSRQSPTPLFYKNYSRITSSTPTPTLLRSYKPNSFYDKNRKSKELLKYQKKKKQLEIIVHQRESRENLKNRLQDEYGVMFRTREIRCYPEEKLVNIAKKIYEYKLMQQSSKKLQKAWKMYNIRKEMRISKLKLNHGARVIQQAWMKFKQDFKKLIRMRNLAATKIQKVFRGYRVRKRLWKQKYENRFKEMVRYFEQVKRDIEIKAVRIIERCYRSYKVIFTQLRKEVATIIEDRKHMRVRFKKYHDKSMQTLPRHILASLSRAKIIKDTKDTRDPSSRSTASSYHHKRTPSFQDSADHLKFKIKKTTLRRV